MNQIPPPLREEKSVFRQILQAGVIAILLFAVILVMIWNTSGLHAVLNDSTASYVSDVSAQLASDISFRIESFKSSLEQLAKWIPQISDPSVLRDSFSNRPQEFSFDSLVIIDRKGQTIPQNFDIANLQDFSGIKASFSGETSVIYVDGQNLLFSTPIYKDGQIDQVLAGIRKKENIQSLIQSKSFSGSGLTCIIDSSGQVVISPTDLKPFLQLDHIFTSGSDPDTMQSIVKMQEDIQNQQEGLFYFTSTDNTRVVMSYTPLGVNDWILLTLVPADLISGEANAYMFRTIIIVGVITFIFMLFMAAAIRFYQTNRKQLEKVAYTDPLTGGMNNAAFQLAYRHLSKNLAPLTSAVVLLNVRGFKLINENFGIPNGDATLKYIYSVLRKNCNKDEMVARSEEDHFFLFLWESDPVRIQQRIDKMIQDVNSFNQHAENPYFFSFSQGACIIDDTSLEIPLLQDRARIACQMFEEQDKCAFYSADLIQQLKKEQEINALFASSLKNHDFQAFLQPKVRLFDDKPCGAEALVRWIHPKRGMIYPSDFIPIFEKNDNICKLDLYIFEEICALLQRWRSEGRELIPISVNLSRQHFNNPNFLPAFFEIAKKYDVPDGAIEFEVTESTFFTDQKIELVKQSIQIMHQHGFLCSLDDFGSGFSSLGLLKEFDVDTIKLDRKFFVNIQNSKAQSIVTSFIDLSKKLGIHIVAEGIETQEQLAFLRKAQCDMVQGYIFSKPLSIADFEAWIQKNR